MDGRPRHSGCFGTATALLDKLCAEAPFPIKGIQVDGGSEFKAEFETACADRGLTHVLPPKRPQLNGAVERVQGSWHYEFYGCFDLPHRIDKLQAHVDAFAHRYNRHRPHQSLDDHTPAEYLASTRTDLLRLRFPELGHGLLSRVQTCHKAPPAPEQAPGEKHDETRCLLVQMNDPICAAVIITMNRPIDLDRLLKKVIVQTSRPAHVIVVDNGMLLETRRVVEQHSQIIHLQSRRNLGGAGGYAFGILHALALGADRVWIMDDDGFPESENCLAELSRALDQDELAMVSPLVIDIEDTQKLAFHYYQNGRLLTHRRHFGQGVILPQFAHLFNGALIRADTFERYGLPRYELFFRGDEVDFMFRLDRSGARFATIGRAAFVHPSGARDMVPIMGGRYHAVVPASDFARFYFYRNRGNLYREFGLVRALLRDLVRYGWAFAITRKGDRKAAREWWGAVRLGWKRDLVSFRENSRNRSGSP